jgi:hypothetical protein
MWRIAALVVVLCAGCSGGRPSWLPDSGIFFDNSRTYFLRERNDLLPPSPGDGPSNAKQP